VIKPTPETVRKVLNLSEVFAVTVTSSHVRVETSRYAGLYTRTLRLVTASYFDSKEVS
jgi:hypothetical protein